MRNAKRRLACGTCILALLVAFVAIPSAQARPALADGAYPNAGLVLGTDGNFYGTTVGLDGSGTVFKITAGGALTTLYNFAYAYCEAGLIQGIDGDFYEQQRVAGQIAMGWSSKSPRVAC